MNTPYFTREPWPHQRDGVDQTIAALSNGLYSVCLTAPTGSGKTECQIALSRWGVAQGKKVLCLTNRILLTDQTRRVFQSAGVLVGTISASMPQMERPDAQVQIATIQTILSRRRANEDYWVDADLILVDEVHNCATGESAALLTEYMSRGARVCGVTATPLGVSNVCDELVVAARTRDLQSDGILCLAHWWAPSELDTQSLVKGKVDLSLSESDARKTWGPLKGNDRIRTRIVGNILEHYHRLHPELTHTLAFAPGVKESLWAAQFCRTKGIRALHVDGTDFWVDGQMYDRKQSEYEFQRAIDQWRVGEIPIIWNRFVMREGVDFPEIKCILLATPVGSYRSFLQMVGRGLRTHKSKEILRVIDHGGNWWRFGSVNVNVDWESVYYCEDPDVLSKNRIVRIRQTGESVGQVCPKCGMVHAKFGRMTVCQHCGCVIELGKASRPIIQADGTLINISGTPIKQWKIKDTPEIASMWEGLYINAQRYKKDKSFNQLYQQTSYLTAVAAGSKTRPNFAAAYHAPRNLRHMPKNDNDWGRSVLLVPDKDLY